MNHGSADLRPHFPPPPHHPHIPRLGPPLETSVHETLRKTTGEHVSCSGMNHYSINLQHVL